MILPASLPASLEQLRQMLSQAARPTFTLCWSLRHIWASSWEGVHAIVSLKSCSDSSFRSYPLHFRAGPSLIKTLRSGQETHSNGFSNFFGCLRLVCYQGIEWDRLELKIEKCITRVTLLLSRELLWACVWAASRPCTFPSWFLPHCCSASTVVFDLRSNLVVDSSLHRSASCLGAIDPRKQLFAVAGQPQKLFRQLF